jgi:micrococcal nuclease
LDLAPTVAHVTGVIDGQTIQVNINGTDYTVRYIGVDAPAANQCIGAQATRANADLVMGQPVRLEGDALDADPSTGILWRYVYRLNGLMANEEMIHGGYAKAVITPPNIKHQGDLNDLEQQARASRSGGWRACGWKSAVAKAPGTCVTITAEALAARVDKVPEVGMLRDGDCVTILKAANADGPEWSGQFIYHPAGTVLPMSNMYLRWKDGIVPITLDANGTPLAHVVLHTAARTLRFRGRAFTVNSGIPDKVEVQALVPDPGRHDMWQIQNPKTWLLRDVGNGKYQVLVDAFLYKSGSMNDIYYGPNGTLR